MRKINRENNNAEILFKAIGDLEEDSYKSTGGENIDPTTKARYKNFSWKKFGGLAACIALVIVSVSLLIDMLPGSSSRGHLRKSLLMSQAHLCDTRDQSYR